ncbi:hypothetical protein Q7P37_002558 [Cladosporium fusiforme]
MAPPTTTDEEQFRFVVKIMPPRRPTNSLFRRLQSPKVEEPLQVFAIPARASETFADVWKHIRERYERNYGAEEVAKGWFHKLQDRFGADIDSHDGVGALGYTPKTPREECVLVMLQNEIDRDGSVPETSGLRPAGFSRPALTAEQEHQAKRRKLQEEQYGAPLEEIDEDTPIESRESTRLRSTELGEDADAGRKVDADGFAVPALPGVLGRKRKRLSTDHDDTIRSSVEGENEEDILVPGSQPVAHNEESVLDSFPTDQSTSRTRLGDPMPADASAGASAPNAKGPRALTAAPEASRRSSLKKSDSRASLQVQKSNALQGTSGLNSKIQPRSPPTPVSGKSQPLTQQPPESAQRPKATPLVASTPANQPTQSEPSQDILDFDPIEDDDLLEGIAGTADDDFDDYHESTTVLQDDVSVDSGAPPSTNVKAKPGKLTKPNKAVAFTPGHNKLELLSGTPGSMSKNPRTRSGGKTFWSVEEDAYLQKGIRQGLTAVEILKKFEMTDRTTSAVRGRLKLLLQKRPELSSQKGVEEDLVDDDHHGPSSSKKRQLWPLDDVQKISRAIAEGYDALEIHATHFPKRSEDAVNRKVLSVQDQVWKNASKNPLFPENHARLEGWTLKDGCKLRRTFREGLPTQEARKRFFGRWEMNQVQKQLDGYKAQIKAMETAQSRATQAAKAADDLALESSQLPANSSPVERSMQARAARRPSVEVQRHRPIEVASSPPQSSARQGVPQTEAQSSAPANRSSSPTVEVPTSEQIRARTSLSRPPSGSGGQTRLNFTREKGKGRAGAPRPSDEDLDAQYSRRPTTASTANSATRSQPVVATNVSHDDQLSDDDSEGHTPADDLDMLDAKLDIENGTAARNAASSLVSGEKAYGLEPRRSPRTVRSTEINNAPIEAPNVLASNDSPVSSGRRNLVSSQRSLLSPIVTRTDLSLDSSDHRRQSRVESGVDTRAAVQLSQELQRSLSREGREEAQQESQAFQTQDRSTTRSQRAAAAAKAAKAAGIQESTFEADDDSEVIDSQVFQTQDPSTTRSQRAAKAVKAQEPRSADATRHQARGLQPSPQLGTSQPKSTPVATPHTTPSTGKLPSRGQSYASKIRDIQRPRQSVAATAARLSEESDNSNSTNDNSKSNVGKKQLPPPTDAEIWEDTAYAKGIGRDRQEVFEDLKIATLSVGAMAREDWDEVNRLKAEERRLKRQRKIAKGDYVSSPRDAQHADGPAQGGDAGEADEDVVRADDYTSQESELEEEPDENIWSEKDFEQPEDMDRERHFSEVEDDEEAGNVTTKPSGKGIEAPLDMDHDRHVSEIEDDDKPFDVRDAARDGPPSNKVGYIQQEEDIGDDYNDDLELPTVPTMTESNGDIHHALTDENLQELNNSGAEGSPVRNSKKPPATENETASTSKRHELQSDDRAAMPPPSTKTSKRLNRRKRKARRHSESASERSSSVSHPAPGSDAPQPQIPSTPVQKGVSGRTNKKPKLSESTPVSQTPKSSRKTQTQTNASSSQAAPASLVGGSQRSAGGGSLGLSGLVRKAHIPTPPKAKPAPQKSTKSKRLTIHADDDESDESSSDSD